VADPGCLSRIPDPTFFHPGSRVQDPNCLHPGSRILIKEVKYFNPKKSKKWFLSSKKYDPGCSSRIQMLTFSHPGSRGQKGTQSRIPDPDPQNWSPTNSHRRQQTATVANKQPPPPTNSHRRKQTATAAANSHRHKQHPAAANSHHHKQTATATNKQPPPPSHSTAAVTQTPSP
jgi:hypothetical protein